MSDPACVVHPTVVIPLALAEQLLELIGNIASMTLDGFEGNGRVCTYRELTAMLASLNAWKNSKTGIVVDRP